MNVFQSCSDLSDVKPLSSSLSLYLKPVARLNISVLIPKSKKTMKTISNWEIIDELKRWSQPEIFTCIKVSKSTLEFIRFEAEIENRAKIKNVIARLDERKIKISGWSESLKVLATEAKPDFPTRHDWDSYFRDAKNMNEMKPGERPDTMHISNLPLDWFRNKQNHDRPCEYLLRRVFEVFGPVRAVDIPIADPYRSQMKSHISGFTTFPHHQNVVFEAYVQYEEYVDFVKAMESLRGMKLLKKTSDEGLAANLKIDFDRTKHLSELTIKRRKLEREKLIAQEREKEENERLKMEEEETRREKERQSKMEATKQKLLRRKQREERRKEKQLLKIKALEAEEMNNKIATEERLLLMAQRKLESIRLLGELFDRVKDQKVQEFEKEKEEKRKRKELMREMDKHERKQYKKSLAETPKTKEQLLREKLIAKFKLNEEKRVEAQKTKPKPVAKPAAKVPGLSYDSFDSDTSSLPSVKEETLNPTNNSQTQPANSWRGRGPDGPNNDYRGRPWVPRQARGRGMADGRGNYRMYDRDNHYSQRGQYFNRRGGYGWQRMRGSFIPPFMDPYMLGLNEYYKYFNKLVKGSRRSHSRSRSRSRNRSRGRSYSRSRSRSYSRSRSRSRSRTRSSRSRSRSRSSSRYSRSKSRSRSRRSRSRGRARSRDRSRTRTKSRSRSRSRNRTKSRSRSKSRSKSRSNRHRNRSRSRNSPADSHKSKSKSDDKPKKQVDQSDGRKEGSVSRDRSPENEKKETESRKPSEKGDDPPKRAHSPISFNGESSSKDNKECEKDEKSDNKNSSNDQDVKPSSSKSKKKKHHNHKKGKKKKKKKGSDEDKDISEKED